MGYTIVILFGCLFALVNSTSALPGESDFSNYPNNEKQPSLPSDGGNENETLAVNETASLKTKEDDISRFPILHATSSYGIPSNIDTFDERSNSDQETEGDIDLQLDNGDSKDDLDTEATFIIGPPYYRPYSHNPINNIPRIWFNRPYYSYHHRPRPVPYIRTFRSRGNNYG